MNKIKSVGSWIAGIVLFTVFCCGATAADSSGDPKPAAVDPAQFTDFMANEALDIQDLAEGAEIQRRIFNRITPPGVSLRQPMFPAVVPFDAANFDAAFLDDLLGEDRNTVAIYPLSLALDPKTRETLVCNAEGTLIAVLPADRDFRAWRDDADPARVTLLLDLLPAEDVEPYLYAESRIAECAETRSSKVKRTPGMAVRSFGEDEFGIVDVLDMTNGNVRLTLTNGTAAAEVYSYAVLHAASVEVVAWTNDQTNVVADTNTLWHPVSPPFNGIESAWACRTTNLLFTNNAAVWEDANASGNDRVRFYAAAKRADSDEDGLTDGAEILVHRTDPGNADTDGDDMPDGWEVSHGLDPLDDGSIAKNNGATGDIDDDGYLNVYEYARGGNPTDARSFPDPDLYVDAAAGANGTGAAQDPFNTIQAALDAAEDYDIVSLAVGTYGGQGNVNLDYAGKPVMVSGAGGGSASIIDCQGTAECGVDFRTGEDGRSVLSNVEICHATKSAIRGAWLTTPAIQHCRIASNQAAFLSQGGAWIRNCEIEGNQSDEGVIRASEDLFLENCALVHNAGSAENAVIVFSGNRLQLINCTLAENPMVPLVVRSLNESETRIGNSIFWSNASFLSECPLADVFVRHSCVQGGYAGVGNISNDAQLTPRGRLKANSPCIDSGVSLAAPPADLAGIPRWDDPSQTNAFSSFDMGAWEFVDADADGMDSGWEEANNFDPLIDDASGDYDEDGLTNLREYQLGTDPLALDTDGDGLNDYAESVTCGTNPLMADTDGDGLSDYDEVVAHETNPLLPDSDNDGLGDAEEIAGETNPLAGDTDNDGMPDGWEAANNFNPLVDSTGNFDGDGLTNLQEFQYGTDPWATDTDGDGLNDYHEVITRGTNPLLADTDGDGLGDYAEVARETNPLAWDTDNDGMPDGWEVANGLNPRVFNSPSGDYDEDFLSNVLEYQNKTDPWKPDTDGDSLSDYAEVITYGTNPLTPDTDGDDLSDSEEITLTTNGYPCLDPTDYDSDDDLLPDGWEYDFVSDPCHSNSAASDLDSDGLTDRDEYRYCTDPGIADTDGDGVRDGDEVPHSAGSNPNDPSDLGDSANCVTLSLTVGDPSGSHSERWKLTVYEVERGRIVCRHVDDGFGIPGTKEYSFVLGKHYQGWIDWVDSNIDPPDYDWQALVNGSTNSGLRAGLYGTGSLLLEDPDNLLTYMTQGNDDNVAKGRRIEFTVLKVDLDGDNEDDGDVDDDDDAVEETLPVIVAINEDTRELTVRKVEVSSGGTLKIKKTSTGKITLKKPGGTTVLGENDAESVNLLPDAGTADLVLTLDGTAVGDVDLELEFASGSFTCSDPFKVKVVRSDVVQRSGNTFLAALIGEARTHSGVDWGKYVTDLYDPGIERISLATYESLADGGPDKKRLRVKKTLYMARRVWAKVYDNMDAQAYTLPTSAHPWNLFTTSTNFNTANCNELITEQFRRAITEVRGELTKPAQQTAFESTWYSGGAANTLTAGKHLVLFPGKSPMAGPTIFLMQTALNYRSKCVGATTQFHNDYEGEILIFFYNGTRYTAGSSCSICGAGTGYPSAPWYVIPFLELWDEAHHSTITPDSFVGSSFFEEITY